MWSSISKGFEEFSAFNSFEKEQTETIINFNYYFSYNKLYKQRHLKRFNFLNKLLKEKKIKTYFWDVTEFVKSKEFEKIFDATNGKIGDDHFSFKGHRNFADMLYKKITNPTLI